MEIKKIEDHPLLKDLAELYESDWKKSHPYDKKPRPYFYVSDAGRCKRQIYYQFVEPEKKRDMAVKTIMMFKLGDIFHDEIQQMLKRLKYTTSKDIEFGTFGTEQFDPRGRLDLLLKENGLSVVSDIKSKNSYAFKEEPRKDEVLHLLFYIAQCRGDNYFKQRHIKIADYGYLIYVDRGGMGEGTIPVAVWKISYDPEIVESMRLDFKTLKEKIDKKEMPVREHEMESIDCQYCRLFDLCWEGIPKPSAPILAVDESIKKPEKELVDSAALSFIRLKEEKAKIEVELANIEDLLKKYFKATGTSQIEISGMQILHEFTKRTELDIPFLLANLKDKWHLFSSPQLSKLREAIEEGEVDPEIFEKAKKISFESKLRIKKLKEAKNAD